jgi:hypothetical protein
VGVDALLHGRDQIIAVEAKIARGRNTRALVRAIQLVEAIAALPAASRALVVLGGATQGVDDEVRAHLLTALHGYGVVADAISWKPSEGAGPLAEAVHRLAT